MPLKHNRSRRGGGRFAMRLALVAAVVAVPATGQSADYSFSDDVRPTLERRCAVCHHGPNAQNGLRVTSVEALLAGGENGAAVVPGDLAGSLLIAKISGEKPEMPPAGDPLTREEVAAIRGWIQAGALDDMSRAESSSDATWWSLRPLAEQDVPAPENRWDRTSIDSFVLAAMRGKGLDPSGEADRRTLIRRLSFDLHGLPPSPEAIDEFVEDPDPNAYERLVDRLLAAPAYGERWGRHWLDVARFGESNGYEQNHLRETAWPYRDWVIRSFNEDKPFDRMILEQLAGDRLGQGDPLVEAATGFLVAGPHDTVGIKNPSGEAQKRANHLDDMIMGTATAFLGLTVHCARCHDHKFDPIRTKDYYRMQAAFAGVWHGERVWDTPARVESAASTRTPLEAEIERCDAGLEALRRGAQGRVAARRDEILAAYRPSVDQTGTEETFEAVEARFVRMTITAATGGRRQVDLDEFAIWTAGSETRNAALGATVRASDTRVDAASPDTYAPANLVDGKYDMRWISAGKFPHWIEVALPETDWIERVEWSSDRLGGFGGRFGRPQPEHYAIEVSLDGSEWKTVATSEGRLPFSEAAQERLLLDAVFTSEEQAEWERLESEKRAAQNRLAKAPKPRTAFLGRFEQPAEPSFVMVRGDPMNKGEEVLPASLSTLGGLLDGFELGPDSEESARRLNLARWIASDDNALTARVIVNRVWMHHFGNPLVRNPSDFGVNGGEPTHPALLDWLANRLVRIHDWRLKPLHREIVLSAAYRQSSAFREDSASIDRDGEYLWRFPPRRLEAEELRDAILAVSGNLDQTMGGPGFRLYRYTVDNVATYYPLEHFSSDTYRRSVYHQHARSVQPELLAEFDCPDTSLPAPKRISTTSPLQALSLLNNQFVLDQAAALAHRVEAHSGTEIQRQIEQAWRLTFGRAPTPEEEQRAVGFVSEHGLGTLGRALLNSNEFVYVF